jgi:hypothetical protein
MKEANSTLSALKLALEALNKLRDFPGAFDECVAATKALRLAIAMEPAPVQEPSGWRCDLKGYQYLNTEGFTPGLPDQESIDFILQKGGAIEYCYTTPPTAQPAPVQEPIAYDGTATEGGARYQADQHLRALLRYTENFYGVAIKHGMKAGETANAIAHIEKSAKALHELVHAWSDVAKQRHTTPPAAHPAKQEQGEPVAEDKVKQLVKQCTHRDVDGNWYVDGVQLVHATCFALDAIMCRNTTPQQRKPLTNEQFQAIRNSLYRQDGWDGDGWDLALKEAIESHHNIKE